MSVSGKSRYHLYMSCCGLSTCLRLGWLGEIWIQDITDSHTSASADSVQLGLSISHMAGFISSFANHQDIVSLSAISMAINSCHWLPWWGIKHLWEYVVIGGIVLGMYPEQVKAIWGGQLGRVKYRAWLGEVGLLLIGHYEACCFLVTGWLELELSWNVPMFISVKPPSQTLFLVSFI